jgi:hypothetical protein
VTVTSLRAYFVSADDMLSRDGHGDEVYAAAFVRRYDRQTGRLAEFSSRHTMPHGDVDKFGAQRIQAGTWTAMGGLRDLDLIPTGATSAARAAPPQDVTFPWRLWEGSLSDGVDAIVITPSIWEQDGATGFFALWEQQQQTLNLSLLPNPRVQEQVARKAFGAFVAGAATNGQGAVAGGSIPAQIDVMIGMPLATLLATSADRPIGLVPSGHEATALPNQVVVLTREIIEAALAAPPPGILPSPFTNVPGVLAPKPGILMVEFYDGELPSFVLGAPRPAKYQMFIQVERVP